MIDSWKLQLIKAIPVNIYLKSETGTVVIELFAGSFSREIFPHSTSLHAPLLTRLYPFLSLYNCVKAIWTQVNEEQEDLKI